MKYMIYNNNSEEIQKVLDFVTSNKYEKSCATFHLFDHLYLLEDIPSNIKEKKPTIQSIYLIADKKIKYDYYESSQNTSEEKEETTILNPKESKTNELSTELNDSANHDTKDNDSNHAENHDNSIANTSNTFTETAEDSPVT